MPQNTKQPKFTSVEQMVVGQPNQETKYVYKLKASHFFALLFDAEFPNALK